MKRTWISIAFVVILFIIVLFSVVNAQPVVINFGFTKVNLPLVLVILGSFLVGALFSAVFMGVGYFQKKRQIKDLNQQLYQAEQTAAEQIREASSDREASLLAQIEAQENELSELRQLLSADFLDNDYLS